MLMTESGWVSSTMPSLLMEVVTMARESRARLTRWLIA